jgi:2-oxoisovalerate dehydrogenase E2 component (dihydrolipoyl transacylase)
MGTHIIKMPDIGEGIAEVELVEWFVKIGDQVAEDQVLADVMTDKATVEIPSAVKGRVVALGGQPGDVLAVGAELIRIETDAGTSEAADAPEAAESAAAPSPAEPPLVAPPMAAAMPVASTPDGLQAVETRAPVQRPLAAPAVRQRAWDLGIELRHVPGNGPQGRVEASDLQAFIAAGSATAPAGSVQPDSVQQIPLSGLRRRIAQRMQEASRTVAHFSYVEEIDVTALQALRRQLNQRWGDAHGHLTLLPLLVRALVVAVREFPQMNAHYDEQAQVISRHTAVHVGVATQSEHGLMVPVLRHAERLGPWASAREIARLASAARDGKASRDELSGSTITLSSLGALGGIASTPLINLPEVAIVGVNRIVERPVVVDGQVVVRSMMNLSSSFDHRVVDGMDAARFIQALRGLLEEPGLLFVEPD